MTKKKNETDKLLGITQAAKLLGVHPLTLRNWTERGYIPFYRTPGGHRRFSRKELLAFLATMNQSSPEDGMVSAAKQAVRSAIAALPLETPVLAMQDKGATLHDEQREGMRSVGQKLLGLTIQYVSGDSNDLVLDKAKEIGRTYGAFAVNNGLSMSETVATFNFFRDTIIETTFDMPAHAVDIDLSNPQLYRRLNHFFNEILLETVKETELVLRQENG